MGQTSDDRMDLLSPLLGSWRTTGQVFEDDGETVAGRIDGFDHCEALGVSFVVHRNDVDIDGEPDFRRGRLDRNRKVGTT